MKLGAFIAAHATASPDKIAVRCGADTITFRQLDEAGDRLAAALGKLGLVHGDRVALFVPSSIEFVQCFAAARSSSSSRASSHATRRMPGALGRP
jgi:acyl-CoA synthetase (AMP-forming)/AMP-acid ligase II